MSNIIDDDILEFGRKTIETEINGLVALRDALDNSFVDAVQLIHKLEGRLIVGGMGKSGHIGRKIAATLASTGTPAYFVHPAEASHGDLGMITSNDAVLLLSNSGETKELEDIIGYCKRFAIPIIGIARRPTSMLMETSTIGISLPEIPEHSPTGAPTTSTTMMLAYGDALAIALLELKGFNRENFGIFHPGGKLGSDLIKTSKLMHSGDMLPLVKTTSLMKDVLIEITEKCFGCAGVLDNTGVLIGIITDGDVRRHLNSEHTLHSIAGDVMSVEPILIGQSMLAVEALHIMNENKITSLFVVDDKTPIGIVHIHDCLRAGI